MRRLSFALALALFACGSYSKNTAMLSRTDDGTGASGGSSNSQPVAGSRSTDKIRTVVGKCDGLAASGQWEEISPPNMKKEPPYTGALVTLVDPNKSGTLYVTTSKSGVFKSTDCGASWKKINTGDHGGELDKGNIWSAVIDPVDSNTLYALTGYGDPNGLWKSTNGGVDWRNITPINLGTPTFVAGVRMDPTNHLHLLINFHDNYIGGHTPVCLGETKDGGKTWEVNWITDQTRVKDESDKTH